MRRPAADAMAQAASPQAIAEYRRKLAEYQEARAAFEQEAGAYWNAIAEKRRGRNAKRREHQPIALDDYVLTQPPVYSRAEAAGQSGTGAPEPERPPRAAQGDSRGRRPPAGRASSSFSSRRSGQPARSNSSAPMPASRSAAGLTREQAVRVYSFETGGTGNHDVQSGIEHGGKRAISTAIGYNQLLTTNSVELMAEQGPEFVER